MLPRTVSLIALTGIVSMVCAPAVVQGQQATIQDSDGASTTVTDVALDVSATGAWQLGPPHRTDRAIVIFLSGPQGSATWEDRIQIPLADVRQLTLSGEACMAGEQMGLEIVMRDGRRLTFSPTRPRKYRELGRDGSVLKDVPLYLWQVQAAPFTAAGGQVVRGRVDHVIGKARNPLGRESEFRLPWCRVRSISFE